MIFQTRSSHVAIAYRDNLKYNNNIYFAKKAFDFIRDFEDSYIIIGDFTKFFDSLDHKYLKGMLCNLLNIAQLPSDFYAVYKNITKYSYWEIDSLLELNKLDKTESGIKSLNSREKALSLDQLKKNKSTFMKKQCNDYGIPQGSAISAVLSNIYMLVFDKRINDYVNSLDGLYMRYSDDFIIVLPKLTKDNFIEKFKKISDEIDSIPNLDLQPDKTQVFHCSNKILESCNNLVLSGVPNGNDFINYLGFTFDGRVVSIRDKTISKYYYRMYRKLKTIVKNNGYTKKGNRISNSNVYDKYSVKGAFKGNGNFITYAKRAEKIFGEHEAIGRVTKRHMKKIKDVLSTIKY